jgi:hypothetical protein
VRHGVVGGYGEDPLLYEFHGSTVQRGWQRTWPNLMSMEAVAGAEFYTIPSDYDYTRLAPRQNTILPFTRNVVGSMDYAPLDFSPQVVKRVTTNAHEAALAVIFESGLQHLSDKPASYLSLPPDGRTYLSHVPTASDETRLLAGAPGQKVVLARRSGARWYVAGINGEDKTKTVKFDLSKVKGTGAKALLLYDDGKSGFASAPWAADKGKSASQTLLPYGGFVLIFGGRTRISATFRGDQARKVEAQFLAHGSEGDIAEHDGLGRQRAHDTFHIDHRTARQAQIGRNGIGDDRAVGTGVYDKPIRSFAVDLHTNREMLRGIRVRRDLGGVLRRRRRQRNARGDTLRSRQRWYKNERRSATTHKSPARETTEG